SGRSAPVWPVRLRVPPGTAYIRVVAVVLAAPQPNRAVGAVQALSAARRALSSAAPRNAAMSAAIVAKIALLRVAPGRESNRPPLRVSVTTSEKWSEVSRSPSLPSLTLATPSCGSQLTKQAHTRENQCLANLLANATAKPTAEMVMMSPL